jgi:hypothetical protein
MNAPIMRAMGARACDVPLHVIAPVRDRECGYVLVGETEPAARCGVRAGINDFIWFVVGREAERQRRHVL